MRFRFAWMLALLAVAGPALAAEQPPRPSEADIVAAIQAGTPQKAVDMADQLIAAYEARYLKPNALDYCGRTAEENAAIAAIGMGKAITTGIHAIHMDPPEWCAAHFLKGYALIDLHQPERAEAELKTATEMAPFNAHYLNEYAELFKTRHDWQTAYQLFRRAADAAQYTPAEERNKVKARSLRGVGYAKIEMGNLDDAEMFDRQALELEPGNPGTLNELKYIAQRKAAAH